MKRIIMIISIILSIVLVRAQNFSYPENKLSAGIFINTTIAEISAKGGYGRIGISSFVDYRVYKHISLMLYEGLALVNVPLIPGAMANFQSLFGGLSINHDITSITLLGVGVQFYLLDGYQFLYYSAGPAYRNYSTTVANDEYGINTTYDAANIYLTHGFMVGGKNRINDRIDFTMHYFHSMHNILDSFLSAGIVFKI